MKKGLTLNRLFKTFFLLLFIVFVIFNSGYYLSKTQFGLRLIVISLFLVDLPLTLLTLYKCIKYGFHRNIIHILFFLFTYIFSLILNFSNANLLSFIIYFLFITVAINIVFLISFEKFKIYSLKTLDFLCVVSLSSFFLQESIFRVFQPIIIYSANNIGYYNGILFTSIKFLGDYAIRNTGVFWEPGLFSSICIFGLIVEIIFNKFNLNKFRIFLYIITIISTQSAAAFFILPFILLLYISEYFKSSYFVMIFILIFIFIIYVNIDVILRIGLDVNYSLFIKFIDNSKTLNTRFMSPLINLDIFFKNPLFGVGFFNTDTIYTNNISYTDIVAQTSTNTYFLASLGLSGFVYTYLWLYSIFNIRILNFLSRIILVILIFLILNKEPHQQILISYLLLFYLYKQGNEKKEFNYEKNLDL